ncbi:TrbI/VirB10 family protein [Azonexus hydrophilus]|uniref:TrbI/VirB10 family protein n=1 Tax=Azonexus hydrophilus TaxID=418702 RepID=A0ABZ2XNQ5_9RHOO
MSATNPDSATTTVEAPSAPELGRWSIKRNLHLWVIGIVAVLLAIFMLGDAIKQEADGSASEAAKKAENEKAAGAAQIDVKPAPDGVAKIFSDQRKEADGLNADLKLPYGLSGEGMAPPLLPVPTPIAGGSEKVPEIVVKRTGEDIEREKLAAQREDDITSAGILSIDRKGVLANLMGQGKGQTGAPGAMSANQSMIDFRNESAARQAATQAAIGARTDNTLAMLGGLGAGNQPRPNAIADRAWMQSEEARGSAALVPLMPRQSPGSYALMQGSVIPAVLISEIRSDLPGQIKAQVSMDVFDSNGDSALLIPKGSMLVGAYNSEVRMGQEKVMAAFTRLIYPSGASVDLNGMGGAESGGESGLMDKVDNHFWKMFATNFLVAGLAQVFQNNQTGSTATTATGAPAAAANTAGQILADTVRVINERNRNIPPTIYVYRGHKFNVMVNRDMLLPPYQTGVSNAY